MISQASPFEDVLVATFVDFVYNYQAASIKILEKAKSRSKFKF